MKQVIAGVIIMAGTIAGLAIYGAYVIKEGINQAIEWLEHRKEEGGEDDK